MAGASEEWVGRPSPGGPPLTPIEAKRRHTPEGHAVSSIAGLCYPQWKARPYAMAAMMASAISWVPTAVGSSRRSLRS
jgi:hypothetical protein